MPLAQQHDQRFALAVAYGMEFGRKAAPGTSHAMISKPLFPRRTVLVTRMQVGIDHHQFAVEPRRIRRQQTVPHTGFSPTDKAVVAGGHLHQPVVLSGPVHSACDLA